MSELKAGTEFVHGPFNVMSCDLFIYFYYYEMFIAYLALVRSSPKLLYQQQGSNDQLNVVLLSVQSFSSMVIPV